MGKSELESGMSKVNIMKRASRPPTHSKTLNFWLQRRLSFMLKSYGWGVGGSLQYFSVSPSFFGTNWILQKLIWTWLEFGLGGFGAKNALYWKMCRVQVYCSHIFRMRESEKLFGEILNCIFFRETPFIVFFNKVDLFQAKLKTLRLSDYLPEYSGSDDCREAL